MLIQRNVPVEEVVVLLCEPPDLMEVDIAE